MKGARVLTVFELLTICIIGAVFLAPLFIKSKEG